ncbi:hypothetical protein DJ535_07985 [Citrobacter murliniae]|uniref:Uncharacterized protein n=1 Tax=Citrobacter murliniae TaxID=67829 RepID=A0ABY2PXE9_9ENTR|nr:hypothetical protein DJ535_07985 [Citrobacter murliniae]
MGKTSMIHAILDEYIRFILHAAPALAMLRNPGHIVFYALRVSFLAALMQHEWFRVSSRKKGGK